MAALRVLVLNSEITALRAQLTPLEQTREICAVLDTGRAIGLTVSHSGIMIPRKSVTAILGISAQPVKRRPSGCEGCAARARCALRRGPDEEQGDRP